MPRRPEAPPPGPSAPIKRLAGGNPQIAKADGDAPVAACIAAMPGWQRALGERLDALIDPGLPTRPRARPPHHPVHLGGRHVPQHPHAVQF